MTWCPHLHSPGCSCALSSQHRKNMVPRPGKKNNVIKSVPSLSLIRMGGENHKNALNKERQCQIMGNDGAVK